MKTDSISNSCKSFSNSFVSFLLIFGPSFSDIDVCESVGFTNKGIILVSFEGIILLELFECTRRSSSIRLFNTYKVDFDFNGSILVSLLVAIVENNLLTDSLSEVSKILTQNYFYLCEG